jgi:hypothetical protein
MTNSLSPFTRSFSSSFRKVSLASYACASSRAFVFFVTRLDAHAYAIKKRKEHAVYYILDTQKFKAEREAVAIHGPEQNHKLFFVDAWMSESKRKSKEL